MNNNVIMNFILKGYTIANNQGRGRAPGQASDYALWAPLAVAQ